MQSKIYLYIMNTFLRLFYRNLLRNKVISAINILGLIIGFLSSLMILEYVYYQRSFDKHHPDSDRVYRVVYNRYQENNLMWETANSYYPTGSWLKENYSEVEDHIVVIRKYDIIVSTINEAGDKVAHYVPKTYYASSTFARFFELVPVRGSSSGLDEPNTVAISERAARKYFGDGDPLGKEIVVNNRERYSVVAVFRTFPENSHIQSDFLFSLITTIGPRNNLINSWGGYDYFYSYVKLKPGVDPDLFSSYAFPQMIEQNYKSKLDSRNERDEFYLQAIPDIHLHSNIEYETETPGNATIVNILFGFAIFLLVIAWINYINLMTARSVERAREIGIKKINGYGRSRLISQFILEAFLLNLICIVSTLVLYYLLNPVFRSTTGISDFSLHRYPNFLWIAALTLIAGILVSSIYPSLVLTSYRPIAVLKGRFQDFGVSIHFRKSLVTFQFIISQVLVTGAIITFLQANLLVNQEMGVETSDRIVIRSPQTGEAADSLHHKVMVLKNQMLQIPEVSNFTFTSDIPGKEIETWFAGWRLGKGRNDVKGYFQLAVDDQFIDFYNINMSSGRKFYQGENNESNSILMNETAMRRFGYEDPEEAVGKILVNGRGEFRVVGITEDFHYYSIKSDPVPTIITLSNNPKSFITLKLKDGSEGTYPALIPKLVSCYRQIFPDQPFEYFSLEEKVESGLLSERTFATVFGLFSGLAIFIAFIGIMGLILVTINQNQNSLAIRKAMGASAFDLNGALSRQMRIPLVLALILAAPLSWFGYSHWFLNNYSYRLDLHMWILVVPALAISLLLFGSIQLMARSVMRMNLYKSLQTE